MYTLLNGKERLCKTVHRVHFINSHHLLATHLYSNPNPTFILALMNFTVPNGAGSPSSLTSQCWYTSGLRFGSYIFQSVHPLNGTSPNFSLLHLPKWPLLTTG